MKFNQSDKDKFPKAFEAIKWLINNSREWGNKTESTEWGVVTTVDKSFKGNLPWYMKDELDKLADAGYKNPTSTNIIGNLYWVSNNAEHYITWEFGHYRSNQGTVKFSYTVYRYHDGLPQELIA